MGSRRVCRIGALASLPMVLGVLVVVAPSRPGEAAPSLPDGFVLRDTPTGQGPYNLTDFTYLPDGSVLTAGKNGQVTWVPAGGTPTEIARLATDVTGDLGLVGLAAARDFASTGHVYVVRSIPQASPPWKLRLSRFTVRGGATPAALGDESVLLEVESDASMHAMTTVVPASDGTLWLSVGDLQFNTFQPDVLKAMDLDEPAGKLLRITPSGAGVSSNPYYDPARPRSWRSRVYASGFRSPFRFSLSPNTGTPVLGDVGKRSWEELDLVAPGHNYKWPCWEGPEKTPGYSDLAECRNVVNTPPLWSYPHGSGPAEGNSVVAGTTYTGSSYPARYRGAFFFGDYTARKLWTLRYDAVGKLVSPPENPPFAMDIGAPVAFGAATNGDIVYADLVSGSLVRLSYTPGNRAPVAQADTSTDPSTRTVTFDGSPSVDFDGDVLAYAWTFGDGEEAVGASATHTYARPGDRFEVTLTVTDPFGASDTVSFVVAPSNHSPVLTLSTPQEQTFAVAEQVTASATARDEEDGALQVRWTSAVLHCAEAATCHLHPGAEGTGSAWSEPFPDHADSSLQLTATVQDSAGVTAKQTYLARPRQHLLRLVSDVPAVLEIPGLSGGTSALVTEGLTVDVTAAEVAQDGVARFAGWADGVSNRTRTFSMGAGDLTLEATYVTPIGRRYADDPALRSLLGAPKGPEVAEGRVRYRVYQRGRLYWSAATGVREVHGPILAKYLSAGGHAALGVPITDRRPSTGRNGEGGYNDFAKDASIFWKPSTGARAIGGQVRTAWRKVGAERGVLGYPITDHRRTRDGRGRFAHFENRGSVYWSRSTGAHAVHGPIWRKWSTMGRERSVLGYPTSGVRKVPGGQRSRFERGVIRWYSNSGGVVVRRQ
jgi:glucose/arabinose dehydrogenase